MTVRVAPREITDYVDRASRVSGCTPSDAAVLAEAVTRSEVHSGGGIAELLARLGNTSLGIEHAVVEALVDDLAAPIEDRQRYLEALARGVDVDPSVWSDLVRLASKFLAAESVLDAQVD